MLLVVIYTKNTFKICTPILLENERLKTYLNGRIAELGRVMAGSAGSDFVKQLKDGVCLAVEELLMVASKL